MTRFGPLKADHPGVGEICPGCKQPLKVGDIPELVAIGPGDDPEERQRAREGRPYNAVAIIAHHACVTGKED